MIKKIFFIAAVIIGTAFLGNAQQLPNDPETRVGKLDNGLTYYIRHNEKPEKQAEFFLATHSGALLETPDQDGLAHFLEHMCFNGTKNFPGKGIVSWLESIGASFGGNVNASTGVEQTIYLLNNIPLVRPTVVDTCILIMHDYSHFVTCDPEEIDKERGVILEEKRSRNTAQWRMREQSYPYLYGDTKYATTSIIGTEENLKTFKPESLLNYYHTWYRPDNQAVIVVGDVDVDYVEARIKDIFSDIPAPTTPLVKEPIVIPDNEKPLIGILTDPENRNTSFVLCWRSQPMPREMYNTAAWFVTDLVTSVITLAMNERLSDLAASPEAPFVAGYLYVTELCEAADAVLGQAVSKDAESSLPALSAILIETEKLRRFGLTDAEVERAKTELLSQFESAANKADTRTNREFVDPMVENFFRNKAFMDPKAEYELAKQLFQMLNADTINMVAKELITRENLSVTYEAPEKEGAVHPTVEQIQAVIDAVWNAELEQAEAEDIPTEFLDASKLKGSKAGKMTDGIYGSKTFTLANGLRVWLLPTEYEKDRIIFNFSKDGGRSLIADEDLYSVDSDSWALYLNYTGVAEFPARILNKMESGKQVSLNTYFNNYTHGISGTTTVKDLETAMQLAYLYYMEPRFDEAEYQQGRTQIDAVLPNLMNMPEYQKIVIYNKNVYDSPRRFALTPETAAKASLATLERVYRQLYTGANGARLVVVGDFDIDTIIPMISKYFGSIPKGKKATAAAYRGDGVSLADRVVDVKIPMSAPKVYVNQVYNKVAPFSVEANVAFSALRYILHMVYTETLREEEGGTYGASVSSDVTVAPDARHLLEVEFETNVDSVEKLRELAKKGLKEIAENGPTAENFDKTVKNLQKRIPESRQRNNYWSSEILFNSRYGIDYDKDYEAAVEALTPEKIQAAAQEMLDGNLIEIVVRPE